MAIKHTARGKWSETAIPHKGWNCCGIDDLGAPSETCQMCESVEIRYVHYMEHPDYPHTLAVGCVCAEHMEQDYVGPRKREKRLRSLARRRSSWAKRRWSISRQKNPYLNSEGFNIAIYSAKPPQSGWRIAITNRATSRSSFSGQSYPTEDAAKAASLSVLAWAKDHLI